MMKRLRLFIGLNLISALLVAGAIGYGVAFPGGEILFDIRSESGFTVQEMDVRTHLMRVLPVQSPKRNHAQWSPDGTRLAYLVQETDGNAIYVTDLTGHVPRLLVSGEVTLTTNFSGEVVGSITGFAWSPDGRRIVVAAETNLWMIDATGDSPPVSFSPLPNGSNYRSVAWSPDGMRLAFDDPSISNKMQVRLYDLSSEEVLYVGDCENPDWSPDSHHLVCVNNFRVLMIDVNNGEISPIGEGFEPSWSPDGNWIGFSRGIAPNVELMLYHVDSGEVSIFLSNGTANLMSDWAPQR
jgi:TolB protein